MFYGYCGFESAIILDLSHSDGYFLHARPGRIEYRTFSSNSILADTRSDLVAVKLHQNGLNMVLKSALRWLQKLFIL